MVDRLEVNTVGGGFGNTFTSISLCLDESCIVAGMEDGRVAGYVICFFNYVIHLINRFKKNKERAGRWWVAGVVG